MVPAVSGHVIITWVEASVCVGPSGHALQLRCDYIKCFQLFFKNKWKPTVLVVPPLFINSTFLYLKCRFEFISALYFYFSVCFSKIQDLSYFFFEIKFTSISVSVQF